MATPYLVPNDLRAVPGLEDDQRFSDALLASYIAEFEDLAENYRGVAFTPREATENYTFGQFEIVSSIALVRARVRSITSVSIDAVTASPTTYQFQTLGAVLRFWSGVSGNMLTVVYSHGFDAPPAPLLMACKQYVRSTALAEVSGMPRDVIGATINGDTYRYSTPNPEQGRPTGYLDVDRRLNLLGDYRVPGVA